MKLTYKEAYDKIIDAYFKNKIKPLEASFWSLRHISS